MNSKVVRSFLLLALLFVPIITSAQEQTGPISLHPKNPHYFLYQGKAIALISSGEHYGAVINLDFDYHKYLATLAADGLNYTRLFPGSYVEVPGQSFGIKRNDLAPAQGRLIAPWARNAQPGYAGGGNKFDLDRWDEKYFTRFHDFLAEAEKRGVVVEISLFSSLYGDMQWKLNPLNAENNVNGAALSDWKKLNTLDNGGILAQQERYARKIVGEANGFDNVIFEIQNEPFADRPVLADVVNPYLFPPGRTKFPNSIELADEASLAWQARAAQWIASEEALQSKKHLIAQNYCDFGLPMRELIPGIEIVNFHYAFPEAASSNYGLGKAIAYDETGFLGQEDDGYRRQAWNFMLSGGGAFDALDYSFSVGHEDGTDAAPNGPGGGSVAFRKQLGILSNFLRGFNLIDLTPDTHTVKYAAGNNARVLSNPGREYAIYLDGDGPSEIILNLVAGEYSGEWIDTKSGKSERLLSFQQEAGEKTLRSPAFQNGIALRLERAGK